MQYCSSIYGNAGPSEVDLIVIVFNSLLKQKFPSFLPLSGLLLRSFIWASFCGGYTPERKFTSVPFFSFTTFPQLPFRVIAALSFLFLICSNPIVWFPFLHHSLWHAGMLESWMTGMAVILWTLPWHFSQGPALWSAHSPNWIAAQLLCNGPPFIHGPPAASIPLLCRWVILLWIP